MSFAGDNSAFRNAPPRSRQPITPATSSWDDDISQHNDAPVNLAPAPTYSRPPPPRYGYRPYRIPTSYSEKRICCCSRIICCLIATIVFVFLVLCAIIAVILVITLKDTKTATDPPSHNNLLSSSTTRTTGTGSTVSGTISGAISSSLTQATATATITTTLFTTTTPPLGTITPNTPVEFANSNLSTITSISTDPLNPGSYIATYLNLTAPTWQSMIYLLNPADTGNVVSWPIALQSAVNANCNNCQIYAIADSCRYGNASVSCTDANLAYCCRQCDGTTDICVAYGGSFAIVRSEHCGARTFPQSDGEPPALQYCIKRQIVNSNCQLQANYIRSNGSVEERNPQNCSFSFASGGESYRVLVAATSVFDAQLHWQATIADQQVLVSNFVQEAYFKIDKPIIALQIFSISPTNVIILCVGQQHFAVLKVSMTPWVSYGFTTLMNLTAGETVQLVDATTVVVWKTSNDGLTITTYDIFW